MSTLSDLLTSEKDLAVFPDPATSANLRKLRTIWDEPASQAAPDETDLFDLSDQEISERLQSLGVAETDMPAQIRDLVDAPHSSHRSRRGLAFAACLAAGIALGVFGTAYQRIFSLDAAPDHVAVSELQGSDASSLDPYLLQPPDVTPRIFAPDTTGSDFRFVGLPGRNESVDLNRVELRELQILLNRFDYGPVAQMGLPSEDTFRAIARFRQNHNLAEGGADRIVLGVLREFAHQEALRNLRPRANEDQQPRRGIE